MSIINRKTSNNSAADNVNMIDKDQYIETIVSYRCRICGIVYTLFPDISLHITSEHFHPRQRLAPIQDSSTASDTLTDVLDRKFVRSKLSCDRTNIPHIAKHTSETIGTFLVNEIENAKEFSKPKVLSDGTQGGFNDMGQTLICNDSQLDKCQLQGDKPILINATQQLLAYSSSQLIDNAVELGDLHTKNECLDGHGIISNPSAEVQQLSTRFEDRHDQLMALPTDANIVSNGTSVILCGDCGDGVTDCKESTVHISSSLSSLERQRICSSVLSHKPITFADCQVCCSSRNVSRPRAPLKDYCTKFDQRIHCTQTQKFICSITNCSATFVTEDDLRYHSRCHVLHSSSSSEENTPRLMCPECLKSFPTWKPLRLHLWMNHEIDLALLRCSGCDFRADTVQRLKVHGALHGSDQTIFCRFCGKGFELDDEMSKHVSLHKNDVTDRKVKTRKAPVSKVCPVCHRLFVNSRVLKTHTENVHEKKKPFTCTICGHCSARKAMLLLHQRTHSDEKPFKCDTCKFSTIDHNTLRRHRMRHTGVRAYCCTLCEYTCIQAIALKLHLKRKHPGADSIFLCKMCHYHTINRQSWLLHEQQHNQNSLVISDTS